MDFSLSNLKSKMLIEIAIIFVLCAMCKGLQCDVEKEYKLVLNKTSTETLKCIKCSSCKPGFELQPPCGTFVLPTDSLRICKLCKDGFYSAKEDMLPCQLCQSETCFAHQIVVGVCKKDKLDTSHCTSCKKGYIMNSDGTGCEVDKLEITTKLPTVATKGPTVSNKTDRETGLSSAKTGLSVAEIILIVIFCSLIPIIIGLCCCLRRRRNLTQSGKDEENTSANTSTTLLNVTKDEQNETINLQGKDCSNGLLTSHGPHMKETTEGFVESKPSNNVDEPMFQSAMSPGPVIQNRQKEPFIQQPVSVVMGQNSCPVNDPLLARVDDLSARIFNKICETFDTGATGKDWRALAGWLDLKTEDVNRIQIKESNKTSEVIKIWAVATESTLARFVQILEAKGMTHLADQIKLELNYNFK